MAQLSLFAGPNPSDFLLALPPTCEFTPPGIKYDWKVKQVVGTDTYLRVGSGKMLAVQVPLRIRCHGTTPQDARQKLNEARAALQQADRIYEGASEWWLVDKILEESPPKYGFAHLWVEVTFTLQLKKQLAQYDDSGPAERRLALGDAGGYL